VTHPPLPCVLSGEGFLLRSRACAGLLFAFFEITVSVTQSHTETVSKNIALRYDCEVDDLRFCFDIKDVFGNNVPNDFGIKEGSIVEVAAWKFLF